jgi:hypothetical protein
MAYLACHLKPACLLGIYFNPGNGGIMFLWNVSILLANCMESHPRRQYN